MLLKSAGQFPREATGLVSLNVSEAACLGQTALLPLLPWARVHLKAASSVENRGRLSWLLISDGTSSHR